MTVFAYSTVKPEVKKTIKNAGTTPPVGIAFVVSDNLREQ